MKDSPEPSEDGEEDERVNAGGVVKSADGLCNLCGTWERTPVNQLIEIPPGIGSRVEQMSELTRVEQMCDLTVENQVEQTFELTVIDFVNTEKQAVIDDLVA